MLKIRLQRSGRKKRANYRIVVAEHSAPIQGRYVDLVGTYDPIIDKHGLKFDIAKIQEWIKKGAKPTNTVARLLLGAGEKSMEAFVVEMKDKKVKNPSEEPEAPAAPAAEAPAAEEAKEEAPAEAAEAPAEEPAPAEEKAEEPAAEEAKPEEVKEEAPAEEATDEAPAEETPADDAKEEAA